MMHLTRTTNVSIIITTHYIEEARQADFCGLMRNGAFLVENSPTAIVEKYQCDSLEDAFLRLCVIQEESKKRAVKVGEEKLITPVDDGRSYFEYKSTSVRKKYDSRIILTIMYKILIQLVRRPS